MMFFFGDNSSSTVYSDIHDHLLVCVLLLFYDTHTVFVEKEIKKEEIPILDLSENVPAPPAREMIDMETSFENLENDLKEVIASGDALRKTFLELSEMRHVLHKTQQFFDLVSTFSIMSFNNALECTPYNCCVANITWWEGLTKNMQRRTVMAGLRSHTHFDCLSLAKQVMHKESHSLHSLQSLLVSLFSAVLLTATAWLCYAKLLPYSLYYRHGLWLPTFSWLMNSNDFFLAPAMTLLLKNVFLNCIPWLRDLMHT